MISTHLCQVSEEEEMQDGLEGAFQSSTQLRVQGIWPETF